MLTSQALHDLFVPSILSELRNCHELRAQLGCIKNTFHWRFMWGPYGAIEGQLEDSVVALEIPLRSARQTGMIMGDEGMPKQLYDTWYNSSFAAPGLHDVFVLYLSLVESWASVYPLVKQLFERVQLYCLVSQLQSPDFGNAKKGMHLALARLLLLTDMLHHNLHRIRQQVQHLDPTLSERFLLTLDPVDADSVARIKDLFERLEGQ